jgi:hypothetical protein
MSHRYLLALLGLLLGAIGTFERGWALSLVWLGGCFLALAIAHGLGAHRVFGKRPDGTLPFWSWVLFLPLHACTWAVWHLGRLLGREPAQSVVTDKLVVGRRLLPSELDGEFENFVDLAAEFQEPAAIRCLQAYRSFPILDGSALTPEALRQAVESLRPGRTFVHCAQGHGRTGLFALAMLLSSRTAGTVEECLRMLTAVRPGIHLSRAQFRCIRAYAEQMSEQKATRSETA